MKYYPCLTKVYKINTQKLGAFLYTDNKVAERQIKKTVAFTMAPERIKYLGMNLSKQVKGLYSKQYKTLMKKLKMTQIQICL